MGKVSDRRIREWILRDFRVHFLSASMVTIALTVCCFDSIREYHFSLSSLTSAAIHSGSADDSLIADNILIHHPVVLLCTLPTAVFDLI
jgi:hypothetical protein